MEKEREEKGKFEIKEKQEIERKIKEIKGYQKKLYERLRERYKEDIKSIEDIEKLTSKQNEWFKKNREIKERLEEQQRNEQQEQERLKRDKDLEERERKEQEKKEKEQEQKKGNTRKDCFSEEESLNRHIALLAIHASEVCANIRSQEQMRQYIERGSR